MGKGFNHLEKNTMQVSKDLLWGMLKNRNAFLYKRKRVQFTKDPLSVNNRHSASNFALIADTNKMNVNVSGKSMTMETVCKGKRRTVKPFQRTIEMEMPTQNIRPEDQTSHICCLTEMSMTRTPPPDSLSAQVCQEELPSYIELT